MKKVQLTLNQGSGGDLATRGSVGVEEMMASRNQGRRQAEELRIKVLDLAERHMDVTLQVLKKWLVN